jgi:hypothetical protein
MDVLKWIALVFVAGFIGYFGKYLAKFLIGRVHKRKAEGSLIAQPAEDKQDKSDYKHEKKRLKLEMKRQKKKGNS